MFDRFYAVHLNSINHLRSRLIEPFESTFSPLMFLLSLLATRDVFPPLDSTIIIIIFDNIMKFLPITVTSLIVVIDPSLAFFTTPLGVGGGIRTTFSPPLSSQVSVIHRVGSGGGVVGVPTTTATTPLFASTAAQDGIANGTSKKKIIVLGGDGFCGWPTSLYLSDQGHDVVIVDNLSRRNIDTELGCDSLTPIQPPNVSISLDVNIQYGVYENMLFVGGEKQQPILARRDLLLGGGCRRIILPYLAYTCGFSSRIMRI